MLSCLVVIYYSLYYLRPTEWVPGIIGTPLLKVLGGISLIYLFCGAISRRHPNIINGQTERMMFGFSGAIALSHLSHFYVGGAINSIIGFVPTLTGFFLTICLIDSRQRLRFFIILIIVLSTFLAYEGWLQFNTGFSHGGLAPIYENITLPNGETLLAPRIRWHGVFNDPNDLGLVLVLVVPFLLDMLLRCQFILPLLSLPLISFAIYHTNSRGTVLAGLVAIGSYFIFRYRSAYGAIAGGLIAVALFLLGPSRMSSVSATEGSAYGRIEAWHEAFQMFKANSFFGIGQGMFTDYHALTAHNSFVLVFAELGFVGLFFFTSIFYFPYHWLWGNFFNKGNMLLSNEDIGLVSAAYAGLTGMIAAMFFISRSYIPLPFMMVALVSALSRLKDFNPQHANDHFLARSHHFRNIMIITILQVIGINIVVKLLL